MKSLANYEEIPTKVSALEVDQSFDQTMKMLNQDQEDYEWNFHQLKSTIQKDYKIEEEIVTYKNILKIENNPFDPEEMDEPLILESIPSVIYEGEETMEENTFFINKYTINIPGEKKDSLQINSVGISMRDRNDTEIASFNSNYVTFPEHTAISADLIQGTLATSSIPNLDASKITSGVLETSQIPDLSSSYAPITNNKIDSSLIPNLDANIGITIDYSLLINVPQDQIGITKASQMTGAFWDSDLKILNEHQIQIGSLDDDHILLKSDSIILNTTENSIQKQVEIAPNKIEISTTQNDKKGYTSIEPGVTTIHGTSQKHHDLLLKPSSIEISVGQNDNIGTGYNYTKLDTNALLLRGVDTNTSDTSSYPRIDINNYTTNKRVVLIAPQNATSLTTITIGDPL